MNTIIVGATGMVGKELLRQLLEASEVERVTIIIRRLLPVQDPKLVQIQSDFSRFDELHGFFKEADICFCCLGTTIKKAGSREAFLAVDYDLVVRLAHFYCDKNKEGHFLVVSSVGADSRSGNFYLKTKGRMEDSLKSLGLAKLTILRPSMLLGNREEFRLGEEFGKIMMGATGWLMVGPLKKYRAIKGKDVALAMVELALGKELTTEVEYEALIRR